MIAAAAAGAAVALTRGPVTESVTPRSAVISFRTATRDHAFVTVQNGARIDAESGLGTRVDAGAVLHGHEGVVTGRSAERDDGAARCHALGHRAARQRDGGAGGGRSDHRATSLASGVYIGPRITHASPAVQTASEGSSGADRLSTVPATAGDAPIFASSARRRTPRATRCRRR